MTKRRFSLKKLTLTLLCLGTLACLMVLPASADVDDDLKSYASTLAAENGAEVGWRRDRVDKAKNERWDRYKLGTDTPSNGRKLLVMEVKTGVGYERVDGPGSNCHMDVSLFYLSNENKVNWLAAFNFDDYAEDYLDRTAALRQGQFDALSIEVPSDFTRLLAVYFHKEGGPVQGQYAWSAKWLRVGLVDGSVNTRHMTDTDGYEFVSYNGSYLGYLTNLDELNYNGWGNHLWRFSQLSGSEGSASQAQYMLELVAGGTSYERGDANVTVSFIDSIGQQQKRTINLSQAYENVFPGDDVHPDNFKGIYDITSKRWMDTNAKEMQGLGRNYVGNYVDYDSTDYALMAYASTAINMVLPASISYVNSIRVELPGSGGNMEFQSVRLIRLTEMGGRDDNYWNGSFSRERCRPWKGVVVAQTTPGKASNVTIGNYADYSPDAVEESRQLTFYPDGSGPKVDNTGTPVAVSVQFADVAGAGVETLAAANKRYSSYKDKEKTDFPADDHLTGLAGAQGFYAYWNLLPFRSEFLTLQVDYKDTLGDSRRVQIPFYTAYMVYLLKSTGGILLASEEDADYRTWISGIFQQNENVGLPFRLAQYGELTGLKLTYGAAPTGFTYSEVSSAGSLSVNASSDPIAVENICFYEGVRTHATRVRAEGAGLPSLGDVPSVSGLLDLYQSIPANFKTVYDTSLLAPKLETELTPAWHCSSQSAAGAALSKGGSVTATRDRGLEAGAPEARDYTNKYVVRIKTADIETAGTTNPVTVSLGYTTKAGETVSTTAADVAALAEAYYGKSYRNASSTYQYQRHMRRNCVVEFVVELNDVETIDSITLRMNGTNEWQVEYIQITALESLDQRYGERSLVDGDGTTDTHTYWRRTYEGSQAAYVKQSVLLYQNNPSKTIYFSKVDEQGKPIPPETEQPPESAYLTTIPEAMTYEETRKTLGLAITKYTYSVDVQVADVQDAGSGNYFYFQLVFANGTSGVVLANQQLASDSFRQGVIESFQIKTTQNYGDVTSVRIICDNTSSTSDVFDKLNIENISVTLASDTGISRTWVVDRVGWIDITYADEGADDQLPMALTAQSDRPAAAENIEVVKEFPITRNATAVDLLFCLATDAGDKAGGWQDGCTYSGKLIYQDAEGVQQTKSFDLVEVIKAYNDTDKTFWLFRPGHTDRFRLTLSGVRSITALELSRTGGERDWVVSTVSVQQIGGLGDVYLSPTLTEYMRDPVSAEDLADGNAGSVSVGANGNTTISFSENSIETVSDASNETWSTRITRVPNTSMETLNIYVFPGTLIGQSYAFKEGDSLNASAWYTTIYGGTPMQGSGTLSQVGMVGRQSILYGSISVSAMSNLNKLYLSTNDLTGPAGTQPIVSHAVIERVKGNVIVGVYRAEFANTQVVTSIEAVTSGQTADNCNQVVRLQLAASQKVPLTAETNDVAIALRYTSSLDPANRGKIYQSPYRYLTDFGLASVATGAPVELAFDVDGVGEIVGLAVVSSGPTVTIDRASVENYSGDPANNSPASRLSSCYITSGFTTSSMAVALDGGEETVVPASFTFTVPEEAVAPGGGSSSGLSMTVHYQDNSGGEGSTTFLDLASYLPAGTPGFAAGSQNTITVLLPDAAVLTGVTLSAGDDSWFLSEVSAQLTLPTGEVISGGTTVNNWARSGQSLEVDLRPESMRGEDEPSGNQILTFSVAGMARKAAVPASAASGSSLLIQAYSGDTVQLAPSVTAEGSPDTSWVWTAGDHANNLSVRSNGAASFQVPEASAGTSYSLSVSCTGNRRLSVPITITVVDPPPEPAPAPEPDLGLGTGTESAPEAAPEAPSE